MTPLFRIVCVSLAPVAAACSVPAAPSAENAAAISTPIAAPGVNTIIKMRDLRQRLDQPAVLARLSQVAKADLVVVREMSMNAFVIIVRPRSGESYERVVARLRSDSAVEYVEPDQQVTAPPAQRR